MRKEILLEKYPIFTLEIGKNETSCTSVDEIVGFLQTRIESDPVAAFIAVFDHYAHTRSLESGEIHPEIKAAKNVVFCFGQKLPDARMLSVRPRSIGVAEKADSFVVTFMEAPMPPLTEKMQAWVRSIVNKG
jgi:hypothetical protein